MKTRFRISVMFLGLGLVIFPAAVFSQTDEVTPAQSGVAQESYSHVRIVRLSFAEGTVTVQRPDVQDWSVAPVNTPIQEGFKLSTAENSFAEVEFENTSTARLGQDSLLNFSQLVLTSQGGKVNRMTLQQGYATFTVHPEGIDTFEVKAQDTTITLAASATTQFRVDIDEGAVRVEVFKGAANVSSPEGQETLTKNMGLDIRPGSDQAFNITRGIVKDAWDSWVEDRDNQESVVRNSPNSGVYSGDNRNSYYGWNDLSNYGSWNYYPGNGYGWAPMAGFGWSPYTDGRWCWYPGFGYTWISYQPWGWLPFHYGGWLFQAGYGWTWFPGSFGSWSPGNVNWSQGSGWVGWTPRPPTGRTAVGACMRGQYCGRIIVRPETLREGRSVTPATLLSINGEDGKSVAKPDIVPSRGAMLPGAPSPSRGLTANRISPTRTREAGNSTQVTSGGVVVGESSGARISGIRPVESTLGVRRAPASQPGVAYDPNSGSFVNSNKVETGASNAPASPAMRGGPTLVAPASPSMERNEGAPGVAPSMNRVSPAVPSNRPSHSEAPTIRYTPEPSSRSHIWGGSRSSSSEGTSPRSNSGAGSGGGRATGSTGSSGGGSRSNGGGASSSTGGWGGGARSSGSSNSGSVGGGPRSSGGGSAGGGGARSSGGSHK